MTKVIAALIVVTIFIALAFFAGRCGRERTYDQREVDRLKQMAKDAERSAREHELNARASYRNAQDEKSIRLTIEQQLKATQAANARLSKSEKDLRAKLVLRVDIQDTSRFTVPVVDAILEQDAQNTKLEGENRADSIIIGTLEYSYAELDTAYTKCTERVSIDAQTIKKLEATKRKPHWWELPAIGAALVLGIFLGAQ